MDKEQSSPEQQQVRKSNMASVSKSTDFPEPWFAKKKVNAKTARQEKIVKTVTVVQDCSPPNLREHRDRRTGRGGEAQLVGVDASKQRKSRKGKSRSALETSLCIPKTAVADVEQLRQKREDDAAACGRTVRTVFIASKCKSVSPSACRDSSERDRYNELRTTVPSTVDYSIAKRSPTWTGASKGVYKDGGRSIEKERDVRRSSSPCLVGKESIEDNREEVQRHFRRMQTADQREPIQILSESDMERAQNVSKGSGKHRRRSRSPSREYYSERSRRRAGDKIESRHCKWPSERRPLSESLCNSPPKRRSSRSGTPDLCRPRRSSGSPMHRKQSGRHTSGEYMGDFSGASPVRDRYRREKEYKNSARYSSRDRLHRPRNDSSSPGNGFHRGRSSSVEDDRQFRRSYTPSSATPPPRRSVTESCSAKMERSDCRSAKSGGIVGTSSTLDRSKRRHRQACRESEKVERQKAGKKPFYLIVDGQGQPYGPGKPAWIAEINKLATHLDPSCTHVRKQTFEGIQTLKDRLHEKFEYSESVNEDHLRGLMGKAVTKRRSELIALIKNGKPQPKHVDHDIWLRLEKLAYSKQHEEKSAQGRHANACRKTVGRTGAIGENGVREKLLSQLRRSPDPDEVEDEMHRDKGYGGRKRKAVAVSMKEEKEAATMLLPYKEMRSSTDLDQGSWLNIHAEDGRVVRKQMNRGETEDAAEEGHVAVPWIGSAKDRLAAMETNEMTKDEYIKELESEIQRLQAPTAKASTSTIAMPSE